MARSVQRHESPQPPVDAPDLAPEPHDQLEKSKMPLSPTRSDGSSESEGRPVREKLKETRIDTKNPSDPAPASSDHHMSDALNGTPQQPSGDQSTSESDSERGRLRRKRSFEDFTVDHGADKQPEKHERHARKKSRDVTSPSAETSEVVERPAKDHAALIEENEGDESMLTVDDGATEDNQTSNGPVTPEGEKIDMDEAAIISPKNKRTRDALERDLGDERHNDEPSKDTQAVAKTEEERNPKRPRDKSDPQPPAEVKEEAPKIPTLSGFSNTANESPFATLSQAKSDSKETEKKTSEVVQTSDEKFKKSGFGSFASSASSPFGALAAPSSKSPFAASENKLSTFASPSKSTGASSGGFPTLTATPTKSAFGGDLNPSLVGTKSTFGTLGSSKPFGFGSQSGFGGQGGFGALGNSIGRGTFATPGAQGISGLKSQTDKNSFGAAAQDEDGDDDDGSNEEDSGDEKEASEQDPRFHQQSVETGEEGEDTAWSGRAKLYTMTGEGASKRWQERGAGILKLNITKEEPKKARFVLRADGTHRLLLNASVSKIMTFGGDPKGSKPTTGQVFFNAPTIDGKLEMHTIRMKNERAVELWGEVHALQERLS